MVTLCLTMIVKNEKEILKRCFDSVVDYIDYWVICDTGSTDGTQEFVLEYFRKRGVPGELHQHQWKNFGHNRTLAVQAAQGKADFLLLMDADFVLNVRDKDFKSREDLIFDGYQVKYEGDVDSRQMLLVSGKRKWDYVGVTHEYIKSEGNIIYGDIDAFTFIHEEDGANRIRKNERDLELLLQGVKDEPNNYRYVFYIAQAYKNLGQFDQAIEYYQKRIEQGGWEEEVYICKYFISFCKSLRGDSFDSYKDELLEAYQSRPIRLEALFDFVYQCLVNGVPHLGVDVGMGAIDTPYPIHDVLFVDRNVHVWRFRLLVAACLVEIGEVIPAFHIYKTLLDEGLIPEQMVGQFRNEFQAVTDLYNQKLIQQQNINDKIQSFVQSVGEYKEYLDNLGKTVPVPTPFNYDQYKESVGLSK